MNCFIANEPLPPAHFFAPQVSRESPDRSPSRSCSWDERAPCFKVSLPRLGLPIEEAKLSKGHIKACQGGFQKANLQNKKESLGCGECWGPAGEALLESLG